jgi:hypothetical protein
MLPVGMGDGAATHKWGSGASASSFNTNHTFHHPNGGSAAEWRSKNQPQDRSGLKYPQYQGMPLPRLNHSIAGTRKRGSTGSREAQSQCRPHIESRRPPYAESGRSQVMQLQAIGPEKGAEESMR